MRTRWLIVLVLALFVAAGCSSMSKRVKCASVGAAAGAAVGATVGGIYGHNKIDAQLRAEWALVGGGIGAVLGGVTGYLVCQDEPQPAPPVEEPAPEPVAPKPLPEKIILNAVQFDFDKAVIKDEYAPVLDAAAGVLKEHGDRQVVITGHTCSIGAEAYNQKLSERRAAAVKTYLVDKGIEASRLTTRGAGESMPVADNTNREGRMMNRRAELEVMD